MCCPYPRLLSLCQELLQVLGHRQYTEQGNQILSGSSQNFGEVSWLPNQFRRWICMVRYWNKLICFEDDRITKIAFNLDYKRCRDKW